MGEKKPISFNEGSAILKEMVGKLTSFLEGETSKHFTIAERMTAYTLVYDMMNQKDTYECSDELFKLYLNFYIDYLSHKVLPALQKLTGEALLKEICNRWANHKVMVMWLRKAYAYMDRHYVDRYKLQPLSVIGNQVFYEAVFLRVKDNLMRALLQQVEAERENSLVDRMLLKDVISLFFEVGDSSEHSNCYAEHFEKAFLGETGAYYRRLALNWVVSDSCPEYLKKVEACLQSEDDRVSNYLKESTRDKLRCEVEVALLRQHENEVLNKDSGCAVLFKNNQTEDLSRVYRLYRRITMGLAPVVTAFKQHIRCEGAKIQNEIEALKGRRDFAHASGSGASSSASRGADAAALSPSSFGYEHQFVNRLLDLHDSSKATLRDCFQDDKLFRDAIKETFEWFCNRSIGSIGSGAELLAAFCDNLLRKGGSERLPEESVGALLEKVSQLLTYVSDKDLFSEFYRKKLSRRLLSDQTVNEDLERNFLQRLKEQCGTQFVSKMEGMMRDLHTAREQQHRFIMWLEANGHHAIAAVSGGSELAPSATASAAGDDTEMTIAGSSSSPPAPPSWSGGESASALDLSVVVLTTGLWPSYKPISVTLPPQMQEGVQLFEEFYRSCFSTHRQLTWMFSQGHALVRAVFDARPLELLLSTLQAAVLLLFNSPLSAGSSTGLVRLSLEDVCRKTSLSVDDASRVLQSLSCLQKCVLHKSPDNKTVAPGDEFWINANFTSRTYRVRIPMPSVDEKKKVVEDVDKDRRHAIDAAIVRLMKSRKVLTHQQIVTEVAAQLERMFKPDARQIKKRIEDLIERDYIARDAADPSKFKYIA